MPFASSSSSSTVHPSAGVGVFPVIGAPSRQRSRTRNPAGSDVPERSAPPPPVSVDIDPAHITEEDLHKSELTWRRHQSSSSVSLHVVIPIMLVCVCVLPVFLLTYLYIGADEAIEDVTSIFLQSQRRRIELLLDASFQQVTSVSDSLRQRYADGAFGVDIDDVTAVLTLLHQECWTHPFVHGMYILPNTGQIIGMLCNGSHIARNAGLGFERVISTASMQFIPSAAAAARNSSNLTRYYFDVHTSRTDDALVILPPLNSSPFSASVDPGCYPFTTASGCNRKAEAAYDAFQRPWLVSYYDQLATNATGVNAGWFSPAYEFATGRTPGITAVYPFLAPNNTFPPALLSPPRAGIPTETWGQNSTVRVGKDYGGVPPLYPLDTMPVAILDIDLNLGAISSLLVDITEEHEGQAAFLIDAHKGLFMGSSIANMSTSVAYDSNDPTHRIPSVVRKIIDAVALPRVNGSDTLVLSPTVERPLELSIDDESYFVLVVKITANGATGLNWYAVVYHARSATHSSIDANLFNSIAAGVVLIIVYILAFTAVFTHMLSGFRSIESAVFLLTSFDLECCRMQLYTLRSVFSELRNANNGFVYAVQRLEEYRRFLPSWILPETSPNANAQSDISDSASEGVSSLTRGANGSVESLSGLPAYRLTFSAESLSKLPSTGDSAGSEDRSQSSRSSTRDQSLHETMLKRVKVSLVTIAITFAPANPGDHQVLPSRITKAVQYLTRVCVDHAGKRASVSPEMFCTSAASFAIHVVFNAQLEIRRAASAALDFAISVSNEISQSREMGTFLATCNVGVASNVSLCGSIGTSKHRWWVSLGALPVLVKALAVFGAKFGYPVVSNHNHLKDVSREGNQYHAIHPSMFLLRTRMPLHEFSRSDSSDGSFGSFAMFPVLVAKKVSPDEDSLYVPTDPNLLDASFEAVRALYRTVAATKIPLAEIADHLRNALRASSCARVFKEHINSLLKQIQDAHAATVSLFASNEELSEVDAGDFSQEQSAERPRAHCEMPVLSAWLFE